jgi:hypothetical protein
VAGRFVNFVSLLRPRPHFPPHLKWTGDRILAVGGVFLGIGVGAWLAGDTWLGVGFTVVGVVLSLLGLCWPPSSEDLHWLEMQQERKQLRRDGANFLTALDAVREHAARLCSQTTSEADFDVATEGDRLRLKASYDAIQRLQDGVLREGANSLFMKTYVFLDKAKREHAFDSVDTSYGSEKRAFQARLRELLS